MMMKLSEQKKYFESETFGLGIIGSKFSPVQYPNICLFIYSKLDQMIHLSMMLAINWNFNKNYEDQYLQLASKTRVSVILFSNKGNTETLEHIAQSGMVEEKR
jgi:hypothetical protein